MVASGMPSKSRASLRLEDGMAYASRPDRAGQARRRRSAAEKARPTPEQKPPGPKAAIGKQAEPHKSGQGGSQSMFRPDAQGSPGECHDRQDDWSQGSAKAKEQSTCPAVAGSRIAAARHPPSGNRIQTKPQVEEVSWSRCHDAFRQERLVLGRASGGQGTCTSQNIREANQKLTPASARRAQRTPQLQRPRKGKVECVNHRRPSQAL